MMLVLVGMLLWQWQSTYNVHGGEGRRGCDQWNVYRARDPKSIDRKGSVAYNPELLKMHAWVSGYVEGLQDGALIAKARSTAEARGLLLEKNHVNASPADIDRACQRFSGENLMEIARMLADPDSPFREK